MTKLGCFVRLLSQFLHSLPPSGNGIVLGIIGTDNQVVEIVHKNKRINGNGKQRAMGRSKWNYSVKFYLYVGGHHPEWVTRNHVYVFAYLFQFVDIASSFQICLTFVGRCCRGQRVEESPELCQRLWHSHSVRIISGISKRPGCWWVQELLLHSSGTSNKRLRLQMRQQSPAIR